MFHHEALNKIEHLSSCRKIVENSVMNKLATLGMKINLIGTNKIIVAAGDNNGTPTQVFQGYIVAAWADFQQPEVPFHIRRVHRPEGSQYFH